MEQTLEIIGTFVGLIYLWLEYRASIYLWIAGIIMPAIYLVVYYKAGLYADVGINIYYLLAAIYGWIVWRYGNHLKQYFRRKKLGTNVEKTTVDNTSEDKSDEELPITKVSLRKLPILTVVFSLAFIAIALLLIQYTDSTVPCCHLVISLHFIGFNTRIPNQKRHWFGCMGTQFTRCGVIG